uniref:metal ABC transporter solute-binding protein, Zn/Mn family n=1 Tax=Candidatus Profftia sp. (ex Adelges kitamiensis) TaxID=2864218 RepID=UPI002A4E2724|nr:zinc ABC transporter substrate-binding protein [Candidatus Profftia sp. (ex Adelges kitamiensis)]
MIHNKNWFQCIIIFSVLILNASIYCAKATILTSIRPLGFIASAIADGIINTEILLPNGSSPHNYALKPSDIKRLHDADLVIWVGPDMEYFLKKTTQQIESKNNLILANLPNIHSLLIADNKEHNINTTPVVTYNKKEYNFFLEKILKIILILS